MSLTDPQSFNRFSRVQNDPTDFIDPSGLQFCYLTVSEGGWSIDCSPGKNRLMDQAATLPTVAAAGSAAAMITQRSDLTIV
jgi:hypothetical protein